MMLCYRVAAADVELPGKGRGYTSPASLRPSEIRALKLASICDGTVPVSPTDMQHVVDTGLAKWTDLEHLRIEITDAGRFRVALEIL